MVDKVILKQKMSYIRSTVSEKKENVTETINIVKELAKDKKDDVQIEWRKLAPKLFV